jgi:glycosyltransferase involved in cell wall biosynthesis
MNATKRFRVLLLCDPLNTAGGVERFVCALANHLVQQGMDVAVGSADTSASAIRYPLRPEVRVLSGAAPALAHRQTRGRVARLWRIARTQWHIGHSLARLIDSEKADVVVLNGLTTACSTLLVAPRAIARRTICCDHNHFNARSRPWRLLRRRFYPRVAALVSLTEADAPRYRALNPNTQVIYNASTLHADLPALPAHPLVLAVGRHVAQKGFDLLVQAWSRVAAELPEARLRVLGDGPLRDATRQMADSLGLQDHIEWLDATDRIEPHFREAAVFVLPSRYEGMPLVLLEAQAMGVPAVAFDCPTGPAEIVTEHTGRLVPAGDVHGLARALLELLHTPALRDAMGRAAIARSREYFSEAEHFARWTALIRQVAAGATTEALA